MPTRRPRQGHASDASEFQLECQLCGAPHGQLREHIFERHFRRLHMGVGETGMAQSGAEGVGGTSITFPTIALARFARCDLSITLFFNFRACFSILSIV